MVELKPHIRKMRDGEWGVFRFKGASLPVAKGDNLREVWDNASIILNYQYY